MSLHITADSRQDADNLKLSVEIAESDDAAIITRMASTLEAFSQPNIGINLVNMPDRDGNRINQQDKINVQEPIRKLSIVRLILLCRIIEANGIPPSEAQQDLFDAIDKLAYSFNAIKPFKLTDGSAKPRPPAETPGQTDPDPDELGEGAAPDLPVISPAIQHVKAASDRVSRWIPARSSRILEAYIRDYLEEKTRAGKDSSYTAIADTFVNLPRNAHISDEPLEKYFLTTMQEKGCFYPEWYKGKDMTKRIGHKIPAANAKDRADNSGLLTIFILDYKTMSESGFKPRPLDPEDRAIYEVLATRYILEYQRHPDKPVLILPSQVWKDRGYKRNPTTKDIHDLIQRIMMLSVLPAFYDNTSEAERYGYQRFSSHTETMLQTTIGSMYLEDGRIHHDVIRINKMPFLYEIAIAHKWITVVSAAFYKGITGRVAGGDTLMTVQQLVKDRLIAIKRIDSNLRRQQEAAARKAQREQAKADGDEAIKTVKTVKRQMDPRTLKIHTVTYKSIYDALGIKEKDTSSNTRKARQRARDALKDALDFYLDRGSITGYTTKADGKGIVIDDVNEDKF